MKRISIQATTLREKYEAYLTTISGIADLTNKEIQLILELNEASSFPINEPKIKTIVANKLNISYKTLNIFLRNMTKKGLLISEKRGEYNIIPLLQYSDKLQIEIV